jgi:CheY-like chemotaxis protein
LNLVLNAFQAMVGGDASTNRVTISARTQGQRVLIEVSDNGPGMPAEVAARIFDPFFTTKPVGVGTGLGLSICHSIIGQLGGEISVQSTPGSGTTFRLMLPVATAPTARVGRARGVLLIESDEEAVARVRSALADGDDLVVVEDAAKAREALTDAAKFDVVLCDLVVPSLSGVDLYESTLAERPEVARRFVFMVGGVLTERASRFLEAASRPLVHKPVSVEALRLVLDDFAR